MSTRLMRARTLTALLLAASLAVSADEATRWRSISRSSAAAISGSPTGTRPYPTTLGK